MLNFCAMLLIDFYKAVHAIMLPKGINKSVSYATPRMSRVNMWDKIVFSHLQPFCQDFLIEAFNKEFFGKPLDEVVSEYKRVMDNAMNPDAYDIKMIENLHKLGYLPIEIRALKEGTKVPMHVPMYCFTNTHPDFAWLPQALESLNQAEMWHPMIASTVGYTYRKIVNQYFDLTCDDNIPRAKALGAFDFRGEESAFSAAKAAAGWCFSFLNTATVPAIPYLEQHYHCNCEEEPVAFGSPSTEHAVMCSNFAKDGDEITLLRRLLTEIYPNVSFSAVLDSYDYWNVIDNVLPQLEPELKAHNGCFLVRGDSGDCVEVITKTVFKLMDKFGYSLNSKGYKVLPPWIKVIYGDSITIDRCAQVYEILTENQCACSNVVLGVGSFSFQCIEEEEEIFVKVWEGSEQIEMLGSAKILKPFTRDTFGIAFKATYCEIEGQPYPIFKAPKEGGFKTSQKGCCVVYRNDAGELSYEDGYTWDEACVDPRNELEVVFKDGQMVREQSLAEVRHILHGGEF